MTTMKTMLKALTLSSVLCASLMASEPSAYGAGNLDSSSPYGLTPEEKALLETKKKLQEVKAKTYTQESKVNSLRDRIDGLQTIVEGLAKKSHENKMQLQELNSQWKSDANNINEYGKRIEAMVTQNAKEIEELKAKLEELQESMSNEYVSKAEFKVLVAHLNEFKGLVSTELKRVSKGGNSLDKISKAEILTKAERYYKKKNYTKAIEYYKYLLTHKYKPARSSYMLGEMYYYRKDYATAIAYFKESAKRYSKAKWMPTLMLHTAVAMQKTGDEKNAQKFLNALIAKYPNSKEAASAEKYLK
jgi:TolA-binding protein